MKLTAARLKKLIREEFERINEMDAYNIQRSSGDYEMKDGTGFDVGIYRSNSGEKSLTVTINGKRYMVGDVSKKAEIISQLKDMGLKQAKQYGGPLHEIKDPS
jgi:hypothetical protein